MQTRLVISGNYVEYTHYEKPTDSLSVGRQVQRGPRLSRPLFGCKRLDNLARARRSVVRKLFTSSAIFKEPYFVTFTFKEELSTHSAKVAGTFFHAFLQRMQRKHKGKLTVVAVPERHQSGRIHIHALLFGIDCSGERKTRALAGVWKVGTVDVKAKDSDVKLLYYVAKYITKQDGDYDYSAPSYWVTRNIEPSYIVEDEHAEWLAQKMGGDILHESSSRSVYFGLIKRITKKI